MSTQPLDLKLTNSYIVDAFDQTDHFEIHRAIADAAVAKAAWVIHKWLDEEDVESIYVKGEYCCPAHKLRDLLEAQGIQRPTSESP